MIPSKRPSCFFTLNELKKNNKVTLHCADISETKYYFSVKHVCTNLCIRNTKAIGCSAVTYIYFQYCCS